jgi:glucosamine-6-phosphate deaminase
MNLHTYSTLASAARATAEIVAGQLRNKPKSNLGLGAGYTFVPFYEELVRMNLDKEAPFNEFRSFQVNEFLGIPGTHPMSYRFFLVDSFLDYVPASRRFQKRLPGLPVNSATTCRGFEERIKKAGGLDIVLLNLGMHDWIGFNEKGTPFESKTHEVTLSEELRSYYAPRFPRGSVPRRGITMGIRTILGAKRIIMLVSGGQKAPALFRMFKAPSSPAVPSTALQKHINVDVFADHAAAAELSAYSRAG